LSVDEYSARWANGITFPFAEVAFAESVRGWGEIVRYKSFRIQNFKGIQDTTINFEGVGGASVFALVGLNESGKTTVLEAIHSFSPEAATSELLGDEGNGVPIKERVPRHSISSFTGYVTVEAMILATDEDISDLRQRVREELLLELDHVPSEFVMSRQQKFDNGDFKANFFSLRIPLKVKNGKHRKWRDPTSDENLKIRNIFGSSVPEIAYFPTFVFDFPERVFLTDRGGVKDRFYRRVFQDILDYEGHGYQISRDIVGRVRHKDLVISWIEFLSLWSRHDDQAKIEHIFDRASATVTKLIFGRWNKIFGEDARNKEIEISFEVAEGETRDARNNPTKTNEHDVFIKFKIKDGTRRFDVNDRSLGFRWFFAFMLFTQFRVARSTSKRRLLFLFDEPAANLHAAAQQKLIESFPETARDGHVLAYTTHSHYMIEPKWLEQTFIVTNRADAPVDSVVGNISLDDESLDIKVASYRSFVDSHPSQTSYFQPILDRLEVVPSRFDMQRESVILEGKSDYYILRYLAKMLGRKDIPLLPALGAGTFGALASLHVGWNLKFVFVLDDDKQGKIEKKRYADEYGIPLTRLVTVGEMVAGLEQIEDLLDKEALKVIQDAMGLKQLPSKVQIRRYFQEQLASDNVAVLSEAFSHQGKQLLDALEMRLK